MNAQTFSVSRVYQADSGKFCQLTGKSGVYRCDDDVTVGASVVIRDGRVVRP